VSGQSIVIRAASIAEVVESGGKFLMHFGGETVEAVGAIERNAGDADRLVY